MKWKTESHKSADSCGATFLLVYNELPQAVSCVWCCRCRQVELHCSQLLYFIPYRLLRQTQSVSIRPVWLYININFYYQYYYYYCYYHHHGVRLCFPSTSSLLLCFITFIMELLPEGWRSCHQENKLDEKQKVQQDWTFVSGLHFQRGS